MGLRLVTPPTSIAATLRADAKAEARVTDTRQDARIDRLIDTAVVVIADYTGRALGDSTWELSLDGFADSIELPRGPVIAVSGVTYVDAAGTTRTLASSAYVLDLVSDPQWLVRDTDADWPEVQSGINVVKVTFLAGINLSGTRPEERILRQAVVTTVQGWFHDPASVGMLPDGVKAMLWPQQAIGF